MLAHVAEAMGIVAAETIAGAETMPVAYDFVPRATYCQPQIGSFGYSEEQAKEKGYDVKTATFPFSANGKAQGLGEAVGFVKVVADAEYNEILGAHLIGPDVTELLPVLTLAQKWDLTADEVARNVFAHPTLSEAIKEAVHGIAGHMINLADGPRIDPTRLPDRSRMPYRVVIVGGGPGRLRGGAGRRAARRRGHRRRHRRARRLRGAHRLRAQQDPDRHRRADDRRRGGRASSASSFHDHEGDAATTVRVDLARVNARVKQLAARPVRRHRPPARAGGRARSSAAAAGSTGPTGSWST